MTPWSIVTEDDGCHGFHWFASLTGVLWAKGWMRTRSEAAAHAQGLLAGRTAQAEAFNAASTEVSA